MTNNEVIKSVRYTLEIKNREVVAMFRAGGLELSVLDVVDLFKNEEDEGFVECPAETIHAFLDGLIFECRGPSDSPAKKISTSTINNNMILRKLRIAFEMRDNDVVDTLRNVGFSVSKSEITALFRAPNHRHYMECGEQFLRNFLKGLTQRYRPNEGGELRAEA